MSSITAVYAALIDVLTTAMEPLDVQVIPGSPTSVTTLEPNILLIGRLEGQRSAGSQNRIRTTTRNVPFGTSQDEYTVEMAISVSRPGTDILSVMAAAEVIFDAARDAIEASDDLGIDGVYEALPTGNFSFDPESDSNGRYVTVVWGVDITARD